MKRILSVALCLVLMLSTAQAAEYYYFNPNGGQFIHAWPDCPAINKRFWETLKSYTIGEFAGSPYQGLKFCPFCLNSGRSELICFVNPDGGPFYHDNRRCPSVSEVYWKSMIRVPDAELSKEPYANLSPCPFCVNEISRVNAWANGFDTAQDVRIDSPGVYRTDEDLTPGLYTVSTGDRCDGLLLITKKNGAVIHAFAIQGEASYSFYLGESMCVLLPEHAVLTPIARWGAFPEIGEQETIRQGRRMLYYEMEPTLYAATSMEGLEGHIILSTIGMDIGQGEPTDIPLPIGETVTFAADLDHMNDPVPFKYFNDPTGGVYFVEFVNCVVWPVDP